MLNKSKEHTYIVKKNLVKDFMIDILDKDIARQYIIWHSYSNYYSLYTLRENQPIFFILIFTNFMITIIFKPYLSLVSTIAIAGLGSLASIIFLTVNGQLDYFLDNFKRFTSFYKAKKFQKKYFNKEDDIITIFKFLKHANISKTFYDKFFQECINKEISAGTILEISEQLKKYKANILQSKINDTYTEQTIDFFDKKDDEELIFFHANKK